MTKRAHGQGSIYKRSDGKWCAQLTLPDGTRKYFYAATQAAAVKRLDKARRAIADHEPLPAERLRLGAFLTDWLENTLKPRTRPLTYKYTAQKAQAHILPALGKTKMVDITTPMIQRHLNTLGKTLAPKTVKHVRDILRAALNDAVAWGLLARNPAANAQPPRLEKRHVAPLTLGEAQQLLAAVQSHRLAALFAVGLACGLRSAEARGLRWEDLELDADQPVMRVRRQLQQLDGQWQLVEPKTDNSRRTIPLPAVAGEALRGHRVRQLSERLKAGSEWQQPVPGLVFTDERGRPVLAQNLSRTFGTLLARAGLPERRFHDLRHACCSLLLAQGVPPSTVMDILGHSNMATTMHIYREVSQAAMAEGVKALDFLAAER
ncbi:MAG TPA: site-specific integrase [Chloroflexota bacterium]